MAIDAEYNTYNRRSWLMHFLDMQREGFTCQRVNKPFSMAIESSNALIRIALIPVSCRDVGEKKANLYMFDCAYVVYNNYTITILSPGSHLYHLLPPNPSSARKVSGSNATVSFCFKGQIPP